MASARGRLTPVPLNRLRLASAVLTVAWAALIYYLSDQSRLDIPSIFTLQDKLLHLSAYAVLGFLALGTQQTGASGYRVSDYWKIAALTALYGVLDEFHQSFVPGRDADIFDVLADTSGGLLGAGVLFLIVRKTTLAQRRQDTMKI
jgi:VanZ family protein